MTADDLIDAVKDGAPEVLRLAEVLSLAIHIEPALVRAARLDLMPGSDPSMEADLWFSPLVDRSGPSGFVLRTDVAERLRKRLKADAGLLRQARAIVEREHGWAPETIQLEERLLWLVLTDAPRTEIEREWESALAALLKGGDGAVGLARWAVRAIDRTAISARESRGATLLELGARLRLGQRLDQVVDEVPGSPADLIRRLLPSGFPTVTVGLRLLEQAVEVTVPPARGAHRIEVPETSPIVLEATLDVGLTGDLARRAVLAEREGETVAPLGELCVWLADDGSRVGRFATTGPPVAMACGSAGGVGVAGPGDYSDMAVASYDDGRVEAWTLREGTVRTFHAERTITAIGSLGDRLFALRDAEGWLSVWPWTSGDGKVLGQVKPDGLLTTGEVSIAAETLEGGLTIWDTVMETTYTIPIERAFTAVAVDWGDLAVAWAGGTVTVWRGGTVAWEAHLDREVTQLALSLRSNLLAALTQRTPTESSLDVLALAEDAKGLPRLELAEQGLDIGCAPDGFVVLGERSIFHAGFDGSQRTIPRPAGDRLALDRQGRLLVGALPLSAVELRTASGTAFRLEPVAATEAAPYTGEVLTGAPRPLGATWDGSGTNFSLVSGPASRVELCLFDDLGSEHRVEMRRGTDSSWHSYLPGVGPGQRYAYRVHGAYAPSRGYWFNPAKLLIDPYAKAIEGTVDWDAANVYPYVRTDAMGDAPLELDAEDDAVAIPKCVVVDDSFDWGRDRPPAIGWANTVIYQTHVKGFTQRHPGVPADLRGTYAGLASPAAIAHLVELGVTAVELLPVHQFENWPSFAERGLSNYWGFNTIGFFAPHSEYAASSDQVSEFKEMVRALHEAGLEVILDVAYHHTAEGNHRGPMLSFRGIDNAGYYRLAPGQELHYQDFTGTGNTLNSESPVALRMIMDSLRYWAQECHVDGFRFGQASALARRDGSVDRASPLLEIISQDPVISGVKLIAEPWDAGPDGYWVGGFPRPWTEWNPRYRIEVRDFWRGASSCAPFATRVSGSEDLYAETERSPHASLNHITAHYGFTLRDLVSYNHKHNEANLEDNRDGSNSNHAWNCGVEGPTDDPAVLALRARQQRNLLTTLFVSQGVPMLLGGDELGRTQLGNNNAWCQDNEISWYDWGTIDSDLLAFTRRLTRLRSEHPVFRRSAFLRGSESDVPDVWWLRPDGSEMMVEDWEDSERRTLGMLLNGEPVGDDSFLLLFNAYWEDVAITLPSQRFGQMWAQELDTSKPQEWTYADYLDGASIELAARSILILRRVTAGPSSMRR